MANRKERRAIKFGHWSVTREFHQEYHFEMGITYEIDCAYWYNVDRDTSRYALWDYTH